MEEAEWYVRLQAKELTCPICCCHYNCPCTLPCGHTFCRQCIRTYWGPGPRYTCPCCQAEFPSMPQLSKNTDLASLLDSLRPQAPTSPHNCPNCPGPGAQYLCLPCSAPLCPDHVTLHRPDPTRQRHLLVTVPTTAWPCRSHPRGLQSFCPTHCAPLCPDCVLHFHSHCGAAQPLLERYCHMEETVGKMIRDIGRDITSREELVASRQNAHREIQILLRNSQRNVSRDFLEMRHYLERQEGGALWRIRQEQDAAQREMQDSVATVTAEISQLRERKAHLEEKLQYDWLDLLKSEGTVCESGTQHPCPLGDPQHLFDCNRIVETTQVISEMKLSLLAHPLLEEAPCPPPKLMEEEFGVPSEEPAAGQPPMPVSPARAPQNLLQLMEEEFGVPSEEPAAGQPPMPVSPARAPQNLLQWARKVWFDPQTVSSRLSLSSNNKTVTVTAANQHYPEGPLRFKVSQVLCAQSFSSGCCYWQVCARQGASWGIGVACAEIERTHRLGRNHLSWCVEWAKGGLSAWHSDQGIGLPGAKPQLVGVFLDCEAKLLSFYSGTGDSQVLLHSYRICFSSRLFPAVWLFGLSRGTSLTITDPTSREPDG